MHGAPELTFERFERHILLLVKRRETYLYEYARKLGVLTHV